MLIISDQDNENNKWKRNAKKTKTEKDCESSFGMLFFAQCQFMYPFVF